MIKPAPIKLKVIAINWLNKKIVKVDFDVVSPETFEFMPGQHITFKINGTARPYSIYSDLKNPKVISFLVSALHEGVGSNFFRELTIGDEVEAMGPFGRFTIASSYKPNIQIYATGTGIAPIITMLHKITKDAPESVIKVYFGVKNKEEEFARDILEGFTALKNADFEFEYIYSRPTEGKGSHVDDNFNVSDPKNTQIYACGHFGMVQNIKKLAIAAEIEKEDIIA